MSPIPLRHRPALPGPVPGLLGLLLPQRGEALGQPGGAQRLDREILYGLLFLALVPLLLLLFRLLNPARGRPAQFVRLFYPQALYLLFFPESILLSQLFYGGRSLDAFFARADGWLFGFQPALEMHRALPAHPALVETFFFGYFMLLPAHHRRLVGALLPAAPPGGGAGPHRHHRLLPLMFVFFALFPVQGPKYYFAELRSAWYGNFHGYLITGFMRGAFDRMNLAGAAFPSSHVVIATVALLLNRRHNPALAWAFLPLTLLLYASTVYLYAHYAVDVLAGLAVGLLLAWRCPGCWSAPGRCWPGWSGGWPRRCGCRRSPSP